MKRIMCPDWLLERMLRLTISARSGWQLFGHIVINSLLTMIFYLRLLNIGYCSYNVFFVQGISITIHCGGPTYAPVPLLVLSWTLVPRNEPQMAQKRAHLHTNAPKGGITPRQGFYMCIYFLEGNNFYDLKPKLN